MKMLLRNTFCFMVTVLLATSSAVPVDDKTFIKVPDECKGQTLCFVKPIRYDQLEEKMNSLLPKYLVQDYEDRIAEPDTKRVLSPKSDWHNCPYYTQTASSYLFVHGENETKVEIIVQTKLFKQTITTVECATDKLPSGEEQCFQDLGLNDLGIATTCQTTNADRALHVFDPDKGEIVKKRFQIPVCCSCAISYKFKSDL